MTKPINVTSSHTDPFSRKYKILSKIGEGSYSEVLKCKNRDSGSIYACKRLKHCYRSWNQVNDIPEIVTLRKLARHPNILQMVEIHFDPSVGRVSLVFELMDMNLYELIKDRKRLLPESRVRVMMFQLMRALRHLHKHGIFHRDVKPENILLKNDLLKLGDLGSVRGLYSRPPYTEYISTRWYRSPECLLTCGYYSFKMDVWAAGCVFYEILTLRPLFPGSSELDQINRVHNVLGPPPQKILQKFQTHAGIERDYSRHSSKQARLDTIKKVLGELKNSDSRNFDWYFATKETKGVETLLPTHVTTEAKDLLKHLLQYDPDSRPSSHRALQHAYFKDLREQAQRAAREKMPSVTGPIVTIVGDEGGLEVVADDNANPVDLATLGDGKLKLKQLPRRTSDHKELKETLTARKSMLYKESSSKLHLPSLKNITPVLKEAGEIFSRDLVLEDNEKKSHQSATKIEPKRTEERVKLARTLANLQRFGGDTSTMPALYQKVYLGVDDDEGDGLNNNLNPFEASSSQLESKSKSQQQQSNQNRHSSHHHPTNSNSNSNSNANSISNSNRRRGSSNLKLDIERKKSMTLLSNDSNSTATRGFPLDFIDKTALTPDALTRINENRRIAHMQPIGNLELNVRKHSNVNSNHSHTTSSTPAKDKDSHYVNSPGALDVKQQQKQHQHQRPPRSPLPMSPHEFSPRTYQNHQRNPQKPYKSDPNHLSLNLIGSPGNPGETQHEGLDSDSHSHTKYANTSSNSTNKQVKELLASLPSRRKMPNGNANAKMAEKGRSEFNSTSLSAVTPEGRPSIRSSADLRKASSKNQLVKNIGVLRKKYDSEYPNPNQLNALSGKNNLENQPNMKPFLLDKKLQAFHSPKKPIEEKQPQNLNTKTISHSNEASKVNAKDSHSHFDRREKDINHNSSRNQNNESNSSSRKQLNDIKDTSSTFNRRDDKLHRNSNTSGNQNLSESLNYSNRDGIVHRHELHKIPDRLLRDRDRERDTNYDHGKSLSNRSKGFDSQGGYNTNSQNINGASGRKNNNLDPVQQLQQQQNLDSSTSLSPTNIRRVIENRRKAELITTDTDADGDNQHLKNRKIDSSKRKRRSRYSTGSSNPTTTRIPNDRDRDSIQRSVNNIKLPVEYAPRRQHPQQVSGTSQSPNQSQNASARISAFVAAASNFSTQSTTNKQVREILAEMRKRRDVLEEKVIKDTNYHSWTKSPKVEDNVTASPKIKSKSSESTLKKATDLPRRDEFGERDPFYRLTKLSTPNNSVSPKLQNSLTTSRHGKSGQVQGQGNSPGHGHGASLGELSPLKQLDQQQHARRRPEDLDYTKLKVAHQPSGYVKYLDSESRLKGLGKSIPTDLTNNNHQSQTGAGSKIFPRNRYATNLHK